MELLDRCSFLDPRVKTLAYLPETERAKVKDDIVRLLVDVVAREHTETDTVEMSEHTDHTDTHDKPCLLGAILGSDYSQNTSCSTLNAETVIQSEVNIYVKDSVCSFSCSPLIW